MTAIRARSWDWRKIFRHVQRPDYDNRLAVENFTKAAEKKLRERNSSMVTLGLTGLSRLIEDRGLIRLSQGDAGGWNDLRTGWRYKAWSYQETVTVHEEKYQRDAVIGDALTLLMQSLAFGELKFARWCGSLALRDCGDVGYEWFCHHTIFMLQLYCRWRGRRHDCLEWDAGPYNAVMDAWRSPRSLKRAILKICDFHCKNSRPMGYGEFWQPPFTLVPFEVAALYHVHEQLKLKTPEVRHPLLDSPFGRIPQPLPPLPADPLLDKVMHRCRKLKPKVASLQKTYWK